MQGGTGQNGPKGGQQAIKMCFETVLDHLEAIGPHLKAKKKSKKNIFFDIFLTFFDKWLGPLQCSAVHGQMPAEAKKITKIEKKSRKKK